MTYSTPNGNSLRMKVRLGIKLTPSLTFILLGVNLTHPIVDTEKGIVRMTPCIVASYSCYLLRCE